jgi:hypothetical protein
MGLGATGPFPAPWPLLNFAVVLLVKINERPNGAALEAVDCAA